MEIILDTCIVQYYLKSETRPLVQAYFERLSEKFNMPMKDFSVSMISKFELLRGAKKILPITEILQRVHKIPVSEEILTLSAFLSSACQNRNGHPIYDDGDCIIGGASFSIPSSYVLTADGDGFPRPFFSEADSFEYSYLKNRKDRSLRFYLLSHNMRELVDGLASHRG